MSASLSPRHRLLLASGLILGLAVLAPLGDLSAAGVARWLLGAVALAGIGWWLWRRRAAGPRLNPPERLKVVSRAGLSQRCGIALVEADGRGFLVAFGDSFAEVREAPVPNCLPVQARRSAPRRRAWSQPKGVGR
ncbi:MAG: MFS transporter [Myxococcaceae bacterium]|nr:MFS transporter [Myxococcaceae bacterium]